MKVLSWWDTNMIYLEMKIKKEGEETKSKSVQKETQKRCNRKGRKWV